MQRLIYTITLLFICSFTSFAQKTKTPAPCGTSLQEANHTHLNALHKKISKAKQPLQKNSATTMNFVPVQLHIVRQSNGTGGITYAEFLESLDHANEIYKDAAIHFYECSSVNYIDDDFYYNFDKADVGALNAAHSVSNVINIFSTESITSLGSLICGFAEFPGGLDVVVMDNLCTVNGSTFSHELGHYFALFHTHEVYYGLEAVDGSDCSVDGDLLCDTPADPNLSGVVDSLCIYFGTAVDEYGESYNPLTNNLMSYGIWECRAVFTNDQLAKITATLLNDRTYLTCSNTLTLDADFHYDYDTDCTNNLTVEFCDMTEAGATSWSWNFGDGNSSTSQSPTHTYTTPGIFTVDLTATNASGSDLKTKQGIVNVGATSVPYVQNFETGDSALFDFIETTSLKNNMLITSDAAKDGANGLAMEGFFQAGPPTYQKFIAVNSMDENANKYYKSKIEMCVDAVGTADLILTFDLKQLFGFNTTYSNFRILADGNQIGNTYQADGTETWQEITIDLNAYANSVFTLAFEGGHKYVRDYQTTNGNATFIDNIFLRSPSASFVTTWQSDNSGASGNNEIIIPATGDYHIYWEEVGNASNHGTKSASGLDTLTFPTAGIYQVEISGGLTQIQFNNSGDKDKLLTIENWGNIAWKNMNSAFYGCSNLTYLATDIPNLSGVTDCSKMFRNCDLFNADVSGWDVSNVINMNGMFRDALVFNQSLQNWNITNVTTMQTMLNFSNLSIANYDSTLIGWAAQNVQSGVLFGANGLGYCDGTSARDTLLSNSWIIYNDSLSCPFITKWQTDNPGPSNDNQIKIPGVGTYQINWEEVGNSSNNGSTSATGTHTITFPNAGTYEIHLSGTLDQIKFDNGGDRQKLLTIENWGNIAWTNMNSAFEGCTNLIYNATDAPDLSNVTNCAETFRFCSNFNGAIGNWDVSNVTTMYEMLASTPFNQDLSNWNLTSLNNITGLFKDATAFNQNINGWNVSNVFNMRNLFKNATSFNQNLSAWNTGSVSNMNSLFEGASSFNQNLGNWNISQVNQMSNMLDSTVLSQMNYDSTLIEWATQSVKPNVQLGASNLGYCESDSSRTYLIDNHGWMILGDNSSINCDINFITTWKTDNPGTSNNNQIIIPGTGTYNVQWEKIDDVSINGSVTFTGADTITFPSAGTYRVGISGGLTQIQFADGGDKNKLLTIENWGNIAWTSMNAAFSGCNNMIYNATDIPDLTGVTDCSSMFRNCLAFNGEIGNWEMSNVTNISAMFRETNFFNQFIGDWDVSNVTDMHDLFAENAIFNKPLENWEVGNVTNMSGMFIDGKFNQDIGAWDVSKVTNMSAMFQSAHFNQDISNWVVDSVTNMSEMFTGANNFNQNIGNWNVGQVTNMAEMFTSADDFNQNLGNWNIAQVTNMLNVFNGTNLSITNYDSTLIGWAAQTVQPNIELGAAGLEYCESEIARDSLINFHGWSIGGDKINLACGFVTTWQSDNTGTSNDNQITIPGTGTYYVQWEKVGNPNTTGSLNTTGTTTLTFPSAGTYRVGISGGLTQIQFNNDGDRNKLLTIENWGNIAWTSMNAAFRGCQNMTYNATDIPDLSEVTDCSKMFQSCDIFNGAIGSWDVSTITNMSFMFAGDGNNSAFNQNINDWNVSNVTDMSFLFSGATQFNQPLNNWNVSNVTDMSSIFSVAAKFNQSIDNWNVSNVTDMSFLFEQAEKFNSPIGNWNVSNVTDMRSMFADAYKFNQPISNWNVSQITNMQNMFSNASGFNQDIGNWNVSNITNMYGMFSRASSFNQDIGEWNVANVVDMRFMFEGGNIGNRHPFNQNLGNWNISAVTQMNNMLKYSSLSIANYDSTLIGWAAQAVQPNVQLGSLNLEYCEGKIARDSLINFHGWSINGDNLDVNCNNFKTTWKTDNPGSSNNNQIIIPGSGTYNVYWEKVDSAQINGSTTFTGTDTLTFPSVGAYQVSISSGLTQIRFNNSGDRRKILTIEKWGNIHWTSMDSAFSGCTNLIDNATDAPDLSLVTDCSYMFQDCYLFNGAIGNWDVSNVTNMSGMFEAAYLFSQDISTWNVSNVTDMSGMFNIASNFNMPIGDWDVSNVTDMSYMFQDTDSFNQNIGNWVVDSVTNMEGMFSHAIDFNQDIGNWNVANVSNMADMFLGADDFNQDLRNWNVNNVTTMEAMFANASAFNQNLGNWNISSVQNLTDMLDGSNISQINYDSTLIGWAAQTVQPNLDLGANGLEYCNGETARNTLIGNGWSINGDTKNCPSISLSVKILLQGALFNGSGIPGTMNDDLRTSNLIPTTSPYADGLTCNSNVFNITGANAIVDWIYLELRDSADHSIIINSRSALLQRDGDIVEVDGTSSVTIEQDSGYYFLAVEHRNHLAIMSASFINFGSSNTSYDFTNSLSAIFGGANSVADLTEGYALFGGDVNDNGQIQNTDASTLIPNLGSAGYSDVDADMNGQVQNTELNNLLTPNIGKGEQF